MTRAQTLIDHLSDEADLCRNDGAGDIANLLDEAGQELRRLSALEQQGEAVAFVALETVHGSPRLIGVLKKPFPVGTDLYTHPAADLTDELVEALDWCAAEINRDTPAALNARAIIAKVKVVDRG